MERTKPCPPAAPILVSETGSAQTKNAADKVGDPWVLRKTDQGSAVVLALGDSAP